MYRKIEEQIVTKAELEVIYTAWGTCAEIPKAGKKTIVCWPNKEHAEITRHKKVKDSDCKGAMYKIEFFMH